LLDVARSSAYYRPEPFSEEDLALMRLIDEVHLQLPVYGSRRIRDELEERGYTVNRKRPAFDASDGLEGAVSMASHEPAGKGHKIYPGLLRDLTIERANQVWETDICYISMARGFMYLVAVMDWHTRKVVSWRVSNTLDTDFCIEALEEALQRFGAPEIFNTDQGSQFTSEAFTRVLKDHAIAVSMDGKGRWVDNVFVERLWRSVKYEDVYLHAYETPVELSTGLTRYFNFYNTKRRHSALDRRAPDAVYFDQATPKLAA
jgi:putative transposase